MTCHRGIFAGHDSHNVNVQRTTKNSFIAQSTDSTFNSKSHLLIKNILSLFYKPNNFKKILSGKHNIHKTKFKTNYTVIMVRAVKIINTCLKKTASCDFKINVQCMKKAPTSIKKVWELSEISSTATFAIIKYQHKLFTKTT